MQEIKPEKVQKEPKNISVDDKRHGEHRNDSEELKNNWERGHTFLPQS